VRLAAEGAGLGEVNAAATDCTLEVRLGLQRRFLGLDGLGSAIDAAAGIAADRLREREQIRRRVFQQATADLTAEFKRITGRSSEVR
jgi:hypothetical protein